MKNKKTLSPVLLSVALVFSLILPATMLNTAPVMARGQVTRVVAADTTVCADFYRPSECIVGGWSGISQIAAGTWHTVGLKSDGTVVAAGDNHFGECDVGGWMEIIVVAAGRSNGGCCEVGNWTGINQTATGHYHTVGLRSDGTVVAVGPSHWSLSYYGQCEVGCWTDIIQVAAGGYHTVGLKDDGTVVAVGRNDREQCEVGNWTGIIQVAAGNFHTVGLKSDGTVVALGSCKLGRCDVGDWTDIIQVGAGEWITVGVKSDGTVVAAPDDEGSERCQVGAWTDIVQVAGGSQHTVGLRSDGTVVAACGWLTTIAPGSGCFIATAAYGTPMAGEIEILCQFRDEYLITNPLGQALVDLYYSVSPPIAGFINEHPSLKPVVRLGLFPAVAMSTVAVNTTLAGKASVLALLILVSVALVVWTRKRIDTGPAHL
jgi:alpha-tubulin suppressor-like RCC1 family protein